MRTVVWQPGCMAALAQLVFCVVVCWPAIVGSAVNQRGGPPFSPF
jgi:hypothetical protein